MARLKAILLFTLIFFILLGCASRASTTPPQPETTTSPTRTPIPTETKVHPTLTFTSTPTPTTTPIWTPLPTLVDQNSFLDFISFTEGSICKFPCWAGIVLGKTSWDEAIFSLRPIEAVAKLDISPNQESSHGKVNIISWYFYGGEFEVDGEFITGSGTDLIWMNIQSFSIPTENTPSHSLPLLRRFNIQSILKAYGVLSMLFVHTFVHDRPGPLLFKVLLVYPENQFYIEYHRKAKLSGNSVVACDSEYYLEVLVLDKNDKLVSVDAIANALETKDLRIENWKPVEQALNISPEKFHKIYSASSPGCMISPSNLWVP